MITIRQCRPDDWETIKTLRLSALADAPYAFSETLEEARQMPDSGWQNIAIRSSRGEEAIYALALDDEKPVGMAVGFISQTDMKRAHVAALWVDPGHRGEGIAKGLVRYLINWASDVGVKVLTASVSLDNLKAQAFYNSSGFEFCEFPWTGRPDLERLEILMKKLLDPRGRGQRFAKSAMGVKATKFAEKRNAPRQEIRIAVNFDYDDKTHTELIMNMSRTGLFISSPARIPVGRDLRLNFISPENGPSTCFGKVVWADQNGIGVQLQ
ncbi:hypothetical protein PITCH_A1880006 [uncultured Desulfobacterium sp.]|uniref:N-acetyltransferase domain-containing protein n=1 Tax=uncultured Desulfobacterium sp. TaxID=201089 RepID=A0A445MVN6_9BACT|nr:hypothetical protein PITCH_A1880006 [uncultured Desulfobacterium sp.]